MISFHIFNILTLVKGDLISTLQLKNNFYCKKKKERKKIRVLLVSTKHLFKMHTQVNKCILGTLKKNKRMERELYNTIPANIDYLN